MSSPVRRTVAGAAIVSLGLALFLGGPAAADQFPIDLGDLGGLGVEFTGISRQEAYQVGSVVAGAGDINADGYDDVIAGSPYADNNARLDSGSAYLVLGSESPSNLDLRGPGVALRIDGAAAGSLTASAVAGAGDVNNDGYDDVIIGAPWGRAGDYFESGVSYVVYGTASPTTVDLENLGSAGIRIDGEEISWSGHSVAGAGDVNRDGYDDVIIGAPDAWLSGETYKTGAAYVILGGATPTDVDLTNIGSAGFRIHGEHPYSATGWSVSGAQDVNNDGYDDVIIGARQAAGSNGYESGVSYVVYGTASPTTVDLATLGDAGFRIQGADAYDLSGRSVAGVGDVNYDRYDDVLIGAPGADNNNRDSSGSNYVVYGGPTPSAVDLTDIAQVGYRIDGAAAGNMTGSSVAGAGDVNDDRVRDLLTYAGGAGTGYLVIGLPASYSVPSTPTDVAAVPGNGQVALSWTAPNNGGAEITGYRIESDGAAGPWDVADITSHTITGLTNGTTHRFRVSAINPAGTGPTSAWSAPVTPRSVPSAPEGVTAVPGNGQVALSWTAPNNGGAEITGYRIESDGTGSWDVAPDTNHTITGLTNGTTHSFRVSAVNAAGTGPSSAWSSPVTPQAPAIPTPPASLSVTARKASKAIPKTGNAALATIAVGPGQSASIRVTVTPAKAKKKITVKRTSTSVAVRTTKAPKAAVRVDITASGSVVTPTSWTRTWKVR